MNGPRQQKSYLKRLKILTWKKFYTYPPNIALSDYHLFWSLLEYLRLHTICYTFKSEDFHEDVYKVGKKKKNQTLLKILCAHMLQDE